MEVARHLQNGAPFTAKWLLERLVLVLKEGGTIPPLDPAKHRILAVKGITFPEDVVSTGQSLSCLMRATVHVTAPRPNSGETPTHKLSPLHGTAFQDEDLTEDLTVEVLTVDLYVKKVQMSLGSDQESKALHKLRRDVVSYRNECVFYRRVAPSLRKAGFAIPTPVFIDCRDNDDDDDDDDDNGSSGEGKEPPQREENEEEGQEKARAFLLSCEFLLVLSCVPRGRFCQHSPLRQRWPR